MGLGAAQRRPGRALGAARHRAQAVSLLSLQPRLHRLPPRACAPRNASRRRTSRASTASRRARDADRLRAGGDEAARRRPTTTPSSACPTRWPDAGARPRRRRRLHRRGDPRPARARPGAARRRPSPTPTPSSRAASRSAARARCATAARSSTTSPSTAAAPSGRWRGRGAREVPEQRRPRPVRRANGGAAGGLEHVESARGARLLGELCTTRPESSARRRTAG